MEQVFHCNNRKNLYDALPEGALVVVYAGKAPRQSADAFYPFFAHRNFVYLTGISDSWAEGLVFMAEKGKDSVKETLFLLPPDDHAEVWNGPRLRAAKAKELSGIEGIADISEFDTLFFQAASSGKYSTVWLNLTKVSQDDPDDQNYCLAKKVQKKYPFLKIETLLPQLRKQRTIKAPCEIDAMREAMKSTKAGILAMMKAAKPGMYEYELKAEYDHALTKNKVLTPAFPSIISAGNNNFCIHYYAYTGQIKEGDMILNDVGAQWDEECNDVSRGWPVSGTYSEKQRLLYTCAYNTSEYMFSIIKPGMPMKDVDLTARKYCYEQLKAIGLCESYDDIGKYMWHGGAHHVGYDVHDIVDYTMTIAPGMVFCVDIGIYCREWGIGFRLEDNCYVTEDGCENLSRDIPRKLEDVEACIAKVRSEG